MKQIILIRHAKVDIVDRGKIDAASLKSWIEVYDKSDIDAESLPSQKTKELVDNADVVLTSTLSRTIDSAKVLDVNIYENNAVFNEAGIPDVNIPFFKFQPKRWLVIVRVLSLLGFAKLNKSFKTSKLQAEEGSKRLLELSKEHDSVVLIGHGAMNWLLRKVLVKEGWTLEADHCSENWGVTILTA
jgi:broad specificity phosphatase PhoE